MENATKQFAEVQSAYEVLSDPQERAWYDSHRDAILRNDDLSEEHFEHNIRLTSAGDIIALMGRFTKRVPFTDTPNGFYGSLRTMFETLAREEDATAEWEGLEPTQYPNFGGADDSYEDVVRPFYASWMGFTTKKTFSWMDLYKYAEAPDRRIRRLMEKENRRLRDECIREFNDAVRSLVAFVRKRDPRYLPNTQSDADRQRLLRGAAAAQAARSRAANQAKLDEQFLPEWMKMHEREEEIPSESEASEEEHYECVTCGKIFKSERQYETHEKSKKHIKAVQQLKRQMEKENKLFKLENDTVTMGEATAELVSTESLSVTPSSPTAKESESISSENTSNKDDLLNPSSSVPKTRWSKTDAISLNLNSGQPVELQATSQGLSSSENELDEEYAPKEVEARLPRLTVIDELDEDGKDIVKGDVLDQLINTPSTFSAASGSDGDGNGARTPKIGKAKAKRAKKASRNDVSVQDVISVSFIPWNFLKEWR